VETVALLIEWTVYMRKTEKNYALLIIPNNNAMMAITISM
jgi:hypothetical protein